MSKYASTYLIREIFIEPQLFFPISDYSGCKKIGESYSNLQIHLFFGFFLKNSHYLNLNCLLFIFCLLRKFDFRVGFLTYKINLYGSNKNITAKFLDLARLPQIILARFYKVM